jgi:hypothetical protein
MDKIKLSYQFAIRDPKTGLFWDGEHRPPYIGFDFRGKPELGIYGKTSENHKFCWSIDPTFFGELAADALYQRYMIDLSVYPEDADGSKLPTKLEIVKFQITETRNYRALDDMFCYVPSIKEEYFFLTKMSLMHGTIFRVACDFLIDDGQNIKEYGYAILLPKHLFRYVRKDHALFTYEYFNRVLFLKTDNDYMLAQMAINDFTTVVDLVSLWPVKDATNADEQNL